MLANSVYSAAAEGDGASIASGRSFRSSISGRSSATLTSMQGVSPEMLEIHKRKLRKAELRTKLLLRQLDLITLEQFNDDKFVPNNALTMTGKSTIKKLSTEVKQAEETLRENSRLEAVCAELTSEKEAEYTRGKTEAEAAAKSRLEAICAELESEREEKEIALERAATAEKLAASLKEILISKASDNAALAAKIKAVLDTAPGCFGGVSKAALRDAAAKTPAGVRASAEAIARENVRTMAELSSKNGAAASQERERSSTSSTATTPLLPRD